MTADELDEDDELVTVKVPPDNGIWAFNLADLTDPNSRLVDVRTGERRDEAWWEE